MQPIVTLCRIEFCFISILGFEPSTPIKRHSVPTDIFLLSDEGLYNSALALDAADAADTEALDACLEALE